ncbi:MAG: peptide ABC transporter substrate-binding protein [Chloroflexi bacterium]|nr:peptide ABC transporter substrate-binding protein [Chloroflexota bacterium]
MKSRGFLWLSALVMVAMLASACAAPTPVVVEKEKIVEKPVVQTVIVETEKVVEKAVAQTVVVEKEKVVEKVVTATPLPGPKTGGRVVVAHRQEPDRFWRPMSGLTVAYEVGGLMNHPMVVVNEKLEYVPVLITELPTVQNGGISADSLTWTLHLRDDVQWHDGKPLTSADVKFTYEMIMREGNQVVSRVGWDQVESVETPDEHTVVFNFAKVDAPFLMRLSAAEVLPKHILDGLTAEEFNNHQWMRAPVGTGPFKFKEWVSGDHITVVKNPDYFVESQPYLDEIVYRIVPDANTLLNMTETGEVHVQLRVQDDLAELLDKMPHVDRVTTQSLTPWLIWINNNHPLFKDVRTRQALAYGFDKEIICEKVFRGLSEPADGPVSPQLAAYNPNIMKFRHDPEKAKVLLEEVGWKDADGDGVREAHGVEGVVDGTPLKFETANIPGEQIRIQLLSLVHAQWKEIGVQAEINGVDVATLFGKMLPGNDLETGYSYIGRYVDPDFGSLYLDRVKYNNNGNYVGYSNPKVDELILASQQTADQALRIQYLQEAQAIIAEEVPQLFMGWRADTTAVTKNLHGYLPGTGYVELWNAAEWWLE